MVYPIVQETEREIAAEVKKELKKVYNSGDNIALVKKLLKLPKFPINDPFVAFLRMNEKFLEYNPQTVNRIANRIRTMGVKAMIEGITQPKVGTKQIGTLFKKWLPNIGYPTLPESDFETYKEIAFLQGSNGQLRDFANAKLGCDLDIGPDFLAKVGHSYIIGDTKFLIDYGGAQNANFENALRLLKREGG